MQRRLDSSVNRVVPAITPLNVFDEEPEDEQAHHGEAPKPPVPLLKTPGDDLAHEIHHPHEADGGEREICLPAGH